MELPGLMVTWFVLGLGNGAALTAITIAGLLAAVIIWPADDAAEVEHSHPYVIDDLHSTWPRI